MGNQQESDERDQSNSVLDVMWDQMCTDLKENKDGVFNILNRQDLGYVYQVIHSFEYNKMLAEQLIQDEYKVMSLDPNMPKIKLLDESSMPYSEPIEDELRHPGRTRNKNKKNSQGTFLNNNQKADLTKLNQN